MIRIYECYRIINIRGTRLRAVAFWGKMSSTWNDLDRFMITVGMFDMDDGGVFLEEELKTIFIHIKDDTYWFSFVLFGLETVIVQKYVHSKMFWLKDREVKFIHLLGCIWGYLYMLHYKYNLCTSFSLI